MAKTDFLTADMTRRQFMNLGQEPCRAHPLRIHAVPLRLLAEAGGQQRSGYLGAAPGPLLVVNADLCTGCQRCEINCTLTNDGVCSSYISRVKIQRRLNLDGAGNGLLSGNDNCFVYFPDTCRQCEDPACGNACPRRPSPPMIRASAWWTPTSASAAAPATRPAPGICPPSTPRPASRPSASPAVPAWQAARPALCPSWTGTPSPAQHRLPTWTCKEEQQWLNIMAGQARSCALT